MHVTSLDEHWRFRQADAGVGYWQPHACGPQWRPAAVPGHVHDDLVRNGLIADPFTAQHEAGCQWVDLAEWDYEVEFEWRPKARCPKRVLRFEGLDTLAAVTLNDETLGQSDNMFVPIEFDVSERLRSGPNRLRVSFSSAVRVGMDRRNAYFASEGLAHDTNLFDERAFVRKAQCMSGWDWGPRLVSCGIWRPVRLLEYEARIRSFEVFQEALADGRFRVWSSTEVEGDSVLRTSFDGGEREGDFDEVVREPRLWWPNGEGAPHLYRASARLAAGQEVEARVGLRTIRLLREPDPAGESFEFEVNGRRIWARGANWIPDDALPSRVGDERCRARISSCQALGMNMLRVWGGGLYESEALYDACDEAGILVWQDFPFACSYYPDDPAFQRAVREEAEHHVRRLRTRASLALWCGNNENDSMWESKWGGAEKSPRRHHGDALYASVLPDVVDRLDPARGYVRSSPTGSPPDKADSNSGGFGDQHFWDVWHGRGDWVHYVESRARFCSEFGFASSCSVAQWDDVIVDPADWGHESPTVRWHDKTGKPWTTFRDFVRLHYPDSRNLEDWVYFSQLNQRDALRCAIEHFRLSEPCRGALIWQFNDCWPVQSWAVRDYKGLLKPAGFELARLFAPAMVALKVEAGRAEARVANDGAETVSGRLVVAVHDVSGREVRRSEAPFEVPPGERGLPVRVETSDFDARSTVVSAWIEGLPASRTWRSGAEPKEMRWSPPRFEARWDGPTLSLTVHGLAYDLVVRDPADPFNVRLAPTSLPGLQSIGAANETLTLECVRRPALLELRSLAGTVEIDGTLDAGTGPD